MTSNEGPQLMVQTAPTISCFGAERQVISLAASREHLPTFDAHLRPERG